MFCSLHGRCPCIPSSEEKVVLSGLGLILLAACSIMPRSRRSRNSHSSGDDDDDDCRTSSHRDRREPNRRRQSDTNPKLVSWLCLGAPLSYTSCAFTELFLLQGKRESSQNSHLLLYVLLLFFISVLEYF